MHEDKQKICDLLAETPRATRNAADVTELEYIVDEKTAEEYVTIRFAGGGRRGVRVTMDSGTAMIRDIMTGLGC